MFFSQKRHHCFDNFTAGETEDKLSLIFSTYSSFGKKKKSRKKLSHAQEKRTPVKLSNSLSALFTRVHLQEIRFSFNQIQTFFKLISYS